jgi:CDP-glucose 4,6-dehydratase
LSCDSVQGVVCVTTDKVYENNETGEPFAESDRIGGHDPYSASKAAAEIAINPYRSGELMGLRKIPVVSVRAGTVIGGGDWSADRLIPDIIRALEADEKIVLRRPDAVRPWQHVLDCLYGYLLVGASMLEGKALSPAYNFAHDGGAATVIDVARAVVRHWGAPEDQIVIERETNAAEAGLLTLDPALARAELGWAPAWSLDESIEESVRFYRDPSIGRAQIDAHMEISAAR